MSEWRVYGCGSASSNRSLQTSYEFAHGDTRLHIDFGNGALYRRACIEGDIYKAMDSITHLFMTHSHADHTMDLTRHVVAWKYTPRYSPGKPVTLFGTAKTLENVKAMLDVSVHPGMYEDVFRPQEIILQHSFTVGELTIKPFPTTHMEGSCGLRIATPTGLEIAFTSDCSLDGHLQKNLKNLDLLVIEASFNETEHHMHLNLAQVGEIAAEVQPKALMLVHLYPEVEDLSHEQIVGILGKWYTGPVIVARDNLALKWNAGEGKWVERMMG